MKHKVKIRLLTTLEEYKKELSAMLIEVVDEGASIGFLPPLDYHNALNYWKGVLQPEVKVLIAEFDNKIVGSVQLVLSTKQNGSHRAEIAKLMTHPSYRRKGIGRALMEKVEELAALEKRSLIVLDTREGDPSNNLYLSLGYIQCGRIPNYAKSADGKLEATIFYYKFLGHDNLEE